MMSQPKPCNPEQPKSADLHAYHFVRDATPVVSGILDDPVLPLGVEIDR